MAAITTAVVAGVTSAYTIASSESQKKEARSNRIKAEDGARAQESQLKQKQKDDAARKGAVKSRQDASSRQRAIASDKQGRQGTILGGAGGAGAGGAGSLGGGQGKTLLGV